VILAQDPHATSAGLLVQRDGQPQVPRGFIDAGEVDAGGQGIGVVLAQDPPPVRQGTPEVPGRASDLALVVEEATCLVEEVGRYFGVSIRLRVADQGGDVREQRPPCRPSRRVRPVRNGCG